MVVFDVVVNGEVKETIRPLNQRLKDILKLMQAQKQVIARKYGSNAMIKRRILY